MSDLTLIRSFRLSAAERSTASDHRHATAPRGTVRPTDTMLAAARQRREGASRAELARLYGVSIHTITQWCGRVREAEEDERNSR